MCIARGLPRNCNKVSQPALIGQSQRSFVWRCWARRGLHHLFVSLLLSSKDLRCLSVPSLRGMGVLDTTKKVTEESRVRDYDLLICTPLNSKLNSVGLCCTLQGVILKHRTIPIHQSAVFSNCWWIDNILVQCSQGAQWTEVRKPKDVEVMTKNKPGSLSFIRLHFRARATSWLCWWGKQSWATYSIRVIYQIRKSLYQVCHLCFEGCINFKVGYDYS